MQETRMNEPLEFLTIIPTFRRPRELRAAITSVLQQDYVTKKVVVVDDCPDGSAAAIVEEFPEVFYLRNPAPSGGWPGRVRNYAFDYLVAAGVNASYVHFLDDDDTVPPGHYRDVKKEFEQ